MWYHMVLPQHLLDKTSRCRNCASEISKSNEISLICWCYRFYLETISVSALNLFASNECTLYRTTEKFWFITRMPQGSNFKVWTVWALWAAALTGCFTISEKKTFKNVTIFQTCWNSYALKVKGMFCSQKRYTFDLQEGNIPVCTSELKYHKFFRPKKHPIATIFSPKGPVGGSKIPDWWDDQKELMKVFLQFSYPSFKRTVYPGLPLNICLLSRLF